MSSGTSYGYVWFPPLRARYARHAIVGTHLFDNYNHLHRIPEQRFNEKVLYLSQEEGRRDCYTASANFKGMWSPEFQKAVTIIADGTLGGHWTDVGTGPWTSDGYHAFHPWQSISDPAEYGDRPWDRKSVPESSFHIISASAECGNHTSAIE